MWRTCCWSKLQYIDGFSKKCAQEILINNLIYSAIHNDQENLHKDFANACLFIWESLSTKISIQTSYSAVYKHIINAHIFYLITEFSNIINSNLDESEIYDKISYQIRRIDLIEDNYLSKEIIITFCRQALKYFVSQQKFSNENLKNKCHKLIGELFIKSANLAMSVCSKIAYDFLLEAKIYQNSRFHYTMACWKWKFGDKFEAQKLLLEYITKSSTILENLDNSTPTAEINAMKSQIYDSIILYGNFMEESKSASPEQIITNYRKCVELNPECEKAYFYLGRIYEQMKENLGNSEENFNKLW